MRIDHISCVAVVCAAVLLCGCERLERRNNGPIRIKATTVDASKSAAVTSASLQAAGKFVLDVIVDDSYREVDSEGHPVGPTYSAGAYVISGGKANVLYSSASNEYTPAKRLGPDHTEGWYIYADDTYEPYCWIDGVKMHFWARYPQDSDVDGSTGKGDLSVTIPGVGETTEDFEYFLPGAAAGSDATNQKDILFAYAERTKRNTDLNDNIDIVFHHPLSEVRFCVSPDDGTFDVNLQIKRIEITNVPDGGSCTFDSDGTVAAGTMFDWTPSSTLGNYSQDYNAYFDVAPTGWNRTEYDSVNHWNIYTCQNAFMLIPTQLSHAAGKEAMMRITFYDKNTMSEFTREAPICGSGTADDPYITWKPGYYYTYKILATKVGRSITTYVILADWSDRDSKINIPC